MTDLPKDEVIRRLRAIGAAKLGGPAPDFLATPNSWLHVLAALCTRAADLIEQLDEPLLFEERQGDGI